MGISLGLCSYLTFLSETQGDILNNFDFNDVAINFARFMLAITMFFTYPMEQFVARHCLYGIIFPNTIDVTDAPNLQYYGITIFLWLISLVIALVVEDLGIVL